MASAPQDRPSPAQRDSSPYVELDRDAWAALGAAMEQPLTEAEVDRVRELTADVAARILPKPAAAG